MYHDLASPLVIKPASTNALGVGTPNVTYTPKGLLAGAFTYGRTTTKHIKSLLITYIVMHLDACKQHEAHANEVHLARQMYPDQIALVANSPSCLNPIVPPSLAILQQSYQALAIPQPSSTELDSRLVVPSINPSDDPVANFNKLMAFISTTFGPRFP
ncbi:hypothetical protein Tco_0469335 [Tanacetum coccineum]